MWYGFCHTGRQGLTAQYHYSGIWNVLLGQSMRNTVPLGAFHGQLIGTGSERGFTYTDLLYRLFQGTTIFIMNNTHPKWLYFCVHSLFYTPEHVRLVHLLKSNGFSLRLHEAEKEGGVKIKTTGKQRSSLYLRPDIHFIFQVLTHFWFLLSHSVGKSQQFQQSASIQSNLCHRVK